MAHADVRCYQCHPLWNSWSKPCAAHVQCKHSCTRYLPIAAARLVYILSEITHERAHTLTHTHHTHTTIQNMSNQTRLAARSMHCLGSSCLSQWRSGPLKHPARSDHTGGLPFQYQSGNQTSGSQRNNRPVSQSLS